MAEFQETRCYTAEERSEIVAMWDQGESMKRIASIFHKTRNQIAGLISRADRFRDKARVEFLKAGRSSSSPATSRPIAPPASSPRCERSPRPAPVVLRRLSKTPPVPVAGVSIATVKEGQCRWPVGEPKAPWPLCGNETEAGDIYCPFHMARSRGGAGTAPRGH